MWDESTSPSNSDSARSTAWLEGVLPGWTNGRSKGGLDAARLPCVVGVLPGEGSGPEIISATLDVLAAVADRWRCVFDLRFGGEIGLAAERSSGRALTPEVEAFCDSIFDSGGAVLCGPGGGRFVYDLRTRFDLFCKLVPLRPIDGMDDAGPLRPSALAGVDVLVVRENVSGLYQGTYGSRKSGECIEAYHHFSYTDRQVARILDVAGKLAQNRRKRLHVVDKHGGAPSISELWKRESESLAERLEIEVDWIEADNASYQLVARAAAYDVIVAPNMVADILADGAAVLLGSRGMSFSGNFGDGRRAVYQTGHGSAYDLAGLDRANPIGQIQSLAMMLRESFGMSEASRAIELAIRDVLRSGIRTADVLGTQGRPVGTREMGRYIANAVRNQRAAPSPARGESEGT